MTSKIYIFNESCRSYVLQKKSCPQQGVWQVSRSPTRNRLLGMFNTPWRLLFKRGAGNDQKSCWSSTVYSIARVHMLIAYDRKIENLSAIMSSAIIQGCKKRIRTNRGFKAENGEVFVRKILLVSGNCSLSTHFFIFLFLSFIFSIYLLLIYFCLVFYIP